MAPSTNIKGAPHAKLVLSALSMVAMMGGWANLTLAEHAARKDAVTSMTLAPAAASNAEAAPAADFTIELPAMPTVVPLKVPTVAPVVVNVPKAAPIAPVAAPAVAVAPAPEPAPVALRVVSAPPRPKESGGGGGGGGGGAAPAPAAQTRSSK